MSLCGAAEPSVPTSCGSPSPTALLNVNISKDANEDSNENNKKGMSQLFHPELLWKVFSLGRDKHG